MSGKLREYCTYSTLEVYYRYTALIGYEMPALVYEPLDYCKHKTQYAEFNEITDNTGVE